MKKFLINTFGWLFVVILISELTIRIFGLAAKTMPTKNINGDYLYEPGKSGYWVRGGLREVYNYYEINDQGYNSIINYNSLNNDNLNIALIGDSYIQGFQSDVRHSVGRQLEYILGDSVVVHEYGKAGSNIVDFALTYQKYIKDKNYDFVFILATDKDLVKFKASNIGRGNRIPKKTLSRTIYDNFHLLRYLNINHGLGVSFNDLIKNGPESIERIHRKSDSDYGLSEEEYIDRLNQDAIDLLPETVIFLHEYDKLSEFFIENYDFQFVKIKHEKQPKDHGFDGHWNRNGRYNCAKAMADFIVQNEFENN